MSEPGKWRRRRKAIARWFRHAFATSQLLLRCRECGRVLTRDEVTYLENTCGRCESDLSQEWSNT
jgi:Zn finger protein HypA/HybF involved in hydrogenase expression